MDFLNAEFITSYGFTSQLPPSQGAEVVFCGRSNVGKSSLINKLCNRKSLARVSSTPGKTTTVNFFTVGEGYVLVDLPGYGYAKRSDSEKRRWAKLLEHFFCSGRNISLVVQLIDIRHKPSSEDIVMLDFLKQTGNRTVVALTKADKLNKTEYNENMKMFGKLFEGYNLLGVFPFSVNGNDYAEGLRNELNKIISE